MGLMTKCFGGAIAKNQPGAIADGSSSLDRSTVLRATDSQAFTPNNPGSFQGVRSVPVVPKPGYFTPTEADALCELAKVKGTQATATKKAYNALKKIDSADTVVHTSHRRYQGKLAGNEFGKKQADVAYGNRLQRLRPGYVKLGRGYDRTENNASAAVANIKTGLR